MCSVGIIFFAQRNTSLVAEEFFWSFTSPPHSQELELGKEHELHDLRLGTNYGMDAFHSRRSMGLAY